MFSSHTCHADSFRALAHVFCTAGFPFVNSPGIIFSTSIAPADGVVMLLPYIKDNAQFKSAVGDQVLDKYITPFLYPVQYAKSLLIEYGLKKESGSEKIDGALMFAEKTATFAKLALSLTQTQLLMLVGKQKHCHQCEQKSL